MLSVQIKVFISVKIIFDHLGYKFFISKDKIMSAAKIKQEYLVTLNFFVSMPFHYQLITNSISNDHHLLGLHL